MKKYSKWFLSLICLPVVSSFTILSSCKHDPKPNTIDNFTYTFLPDKKSIAIDGLSQNAISHNLSDIVIGNSYKINSKNYNVTTINDYAFYHYQHIHSFILPKTLISIKQFAFSDINSPMLLSEDDRNANVDSRCINLDLSRCNKLSEIGQYAFHHVVSNHFDLPSNNKVLTSIGSHAFSGVKFWNDLDFTRFKKLKNLGAWEFYGCENGKTGTDGKRNNKNKIILPNTTTNDCLFTWSDADIVYWNITTPPMLSEASSMHVFFSSFKEFHVNINSDIQTWGNWFATNGTYGNREPIYYANVIADINDNGSIADVPAWELSFGSEFDDDTLDSTIEQLIQDAEQIPIIGPLIADLIDGDFENAYSTVLDTNGEPTEWGQEIINDLFPSWNNDVKAGCHMLQCESLLLWDRYLRFTQ